MNDDNLGNFLDAGSFDEEEDDNSENWKPARIHGRALFKKSIDILNLTETICDVLPDDDHAEVTRRLMLENATIVPAKIKGAMGMDGVYCILMENAVIIKVNICQLKAQLWACSALHEIEDKYLDVVKTEIDEFKKIFIQWVGSFDKENDLPDEWHLFNDPTSFPDDDEPFDAKSFMANFDPDDDI
ncbi:MAG: hypothetical protein ABIQ31_12305 [Ferruginibacter sp.]